MPLPKKKKFLQEIVEPEKKIPETVEELEEEEDTLITTSHAPKSKFSFMQEIIEEDLTEDE